MKSKTAGRTSRKTITKCCPKCSLHIPTACRSCKCGHQFRRPSEAIPKPKVVLEIPASPPPEDTDTAPGTRRRRTERVRRNRPDFYQALEYEQHFAKRQRTTSGTSATVSSADGAKVKRKQDRDKRMVNRDKQKESCSSTEGSTGGKEKEPEIDLYADVTPERMMQYSIILAELNRKFRTQTFKPV